VTSRERVLAACAHRAPDRIPRFDGFWQFPDAWRGRFGPAEELTDIEIWVPEEGTFPTRAGRLREVDGWVYEVSSWGATQRSRAGTFFSETVEVPIPVGVDPDSVVFDPPELEARFLRGCASVGEAAELLARAKGRHCVFGKTGGPYLRSTFVRGEEQFLMDMAADPPFARALAEKVGRHLAAVGCEEIRRWSLQDTGIFIYDDMAHNLGPMFGPETFERVLLPAYREMISAYRSSGARHVFLHSDGDIRPILDMLVDAGVEGLNPLERRAGMAIEEIRKRYPRLVLTGGMCNTRTLVEGPVAKVRDEARRIIDLGRNGGIVIGTHSVSPEIPIEHFAAYVEECERYGAFG